ncbi:MAG TPA: hypothetical protein VMC43_03245 [Candidatus Paceibacterota bacterium]|nr:hypothetical protein [Candidatus Paceibacterota bacterium]
MAIVIEEQRENGSNLGSVLVWVGILIIIAAAVYYLFFAQPELIEVAAPSGFQATEQITKIDLNADDVVKSGSFAALQEHVTLPTNDQFGRPNPFLAFPETVAPPARPTKTK